MKGKFLEEGQLLALGQDENINAGNAEDIEVEGIDISKWDKCNRLWLVPALHRLRVLPQHHDSQVAGHCGRYGTQDLVSQNFRCDRWSEDVANDLAACIQYQKSRVDRHGRETKLVPMPSGEGPFGEIAMDFVGELPY